VMYAITYPVFDYGGASLSQPHPKNAY